jgi:putative ABC transport system permease protein
VIFIRNLFRHKARTIITLLGTTIGIAIFVTNVAITNNLDNEAKHVVEEYSTDVTVQSKRADSPIRSRIKPDELNELKTIFGDNISPLVLGTIQENWNSNVVVVGADSKFISRFGVVEGYSSTTNFSEIMVGQLLAQKSDLRAGAMVQIGNQSSKIAGIFSTGNRMLDCTILLDISRAQQILGSEGKINIAIIRVANKSQTPNVVRQINTRFSGLIARSYSDFIGNMRFFRTINTFSKSISIIALLSACLVITNTLLMAVSERTREIGILMAVGWHPLLILRMLLSESLALCLTGTVLGNLLALIILKTLSNSKLIGFGWIPVTISVETAVTSFAVALLLAVISLLWPAHILFRLAPIDAIRHE